MSDILEATLDCIKAGLEAGKPESAETGDHEIASTIDSMLQTFRMKYEITEQDIANADAWDNGFENIVDDYKLLSYDIMMTVWEHIDSLMRDTMSGEVVKEVLANNFFGRPLSWEKEK